MRSWVRATCRPIADPPSTSQVELSIGRSPLCVPGSGVDHTGFGERRSGPPPPMGAEPIGADPIAEFAISYSPRESTKCVKPHRRWVVVQFESAR